MAQVTATDATAILPAQALLIARDGREIPIGDSGSPIKAPDGRFLGIVVVFRDTTAEREAERQRAGALEREQAARRTAETLSRAKDEFVATVSHELRTPLNAIFGWVAMLKLGALDAAGQTKALDVIDRNIRAQAQLIEDLLDMARVIRGTVRIEMLSVDLAAVIEAAVDAVKPAADARRVSLHIHAAREQAVVSGDPARLQQIVWNLLSNSIKFSNTGDRVEITLAADGDDAVLTVHDTGTGIDPAFLPHVFERFRQETSAVTREHAGLGLGLSLVRHLTELHGGTVQAESEGKTHGAVFTVRIPLLTAERRERLGADGADTVPSQEMLPTSLQHIHVLAVDDDVDARELIAAVLQQAGARVTSAASVQEALAAIAAQVPTVVLTDIAMPHATGFDLVRELRSSPLWQRRAGDCVDGLRKSRGSRAGAWPRIHRASRQAVLTASARGARRRRRQEVADLSRRGRGGRGADGYRRVRTAWLGAALHLPALDVDYGRRGIAVPNLAFSPDLLEMMAAGREVFEHAARDAILDLQPARAGVCRIPADEKAGRLDGMLRVHAAVDDVEDDVVDRGRDPVVAGGADRKAWATQRCGRARRLEHERRHRRRRRPGQRQEAAGGATAEAKVIVVEEAQAVGHVERAAPCAQRLRNRDHVAVGIGDGKRRGPAADPLWRRIRRRRRPIPISLGRIDTLEEVCRMARLEMRSQRDVPQRGIGNSRTLIAHPPRLYGVVEIVGVGRVGSAGLRLVVLQDLQRLDQRRPCRHRGRRGIDLMIAVSAG